MPAKPASPVLQTSHPLHSILAACWPLCEGTGATLTDIVGGKNLTTTGTWSTGASGPQQNFSGSQNAVSNASDLFAAAQLVRGSIEVWLATNTSQNGKYIFANEGWIGVEQNGSIGRAFSDGNPTYATGTSNIADGNLHQLVYTWDNSPLSGKFYTDAALQGSCTPANAPLLDSTSRVLALASQFNSTAHWTGSVVAVKLYNAPLSQAQITTEYADPWAIFTPGGAASGLLMARRRIALSC